MRISLFICLMFICAVTHALTIDERLHQAISFKHHDPHLAVSQLEALLSNRWNLNENQRLTSGFTLFRLYLKLGQYNKAETLLDTLTSQTRSLPLWPPWLAIMNANLKLVSFHKDAAKDQLKPYLILFESDQFPKLTMWYSLIQGVILVRENNYEMAFTMLGRAQDMAESLGDSSAKLAAMDQVVNILYYSQDYEKALLNNEQLRAQSRTLGDAFSIAKTMSNQMNIYYMMSVLEKEKLATLQKHATPDTQIIDVTRERMQSFEKEARIQESRLLDFSHKIGSHQLKVRALVNKQNLLLREKAYREAVKVGQKAADIAKAHGFPFEEAVSYNNMAIAYRSLRQHDDSIATLKKAESVYKLIQNDQFNLWILEDFSIAYEMNGQYQLALDYYKKFHQADAELKRKTQNRQVLALKERHESQRKAKEITQLKQQSALKKAEESNQSVQIRAITGVGLAICLSMALIFSRNIVIARKNKSLDQQNKQLHELSLRDPLTGLYNRRKLDEVKTDLTNGAHHQSSTDRGFNNIGVIMLDIDNLKNINESHGHDMGDQVIKKISDEISQQLRSGDVAIRLEGEAFLIVLFDVEEHGISAFCSRMLKVRNESPIQINDTDFNVTISMGYVLFPALSHEGIGLDWEENIKIADLLLYLAKRNGRNRAETLVFTDGGESIVSKQAIMKSLMSNQGNFPEEFHVVQKTLTYPTAA